MTKIDAKKIELRIKKRRIKLKNINFNTNN